jgi:ABC-type bacteriocin/lantibiotic exporter with double-glycine peptidase domain
VAVCALIFMSRRKHLTDLSKAAEMQQRSADGFVFDVVSALKTVISRDTIQKELRDIEKHIQMSEKMTIEMNHATDNLNYAINLAVAVVIFSIMGLAVGKLKTPESKVVNILAALSLMSSLRGKLTGLSSTNVATVAEFARGQANQLHELDAEDVWSNQPRDLHCLDDTSSSSQTSGMHVRFENVTFGYSNSDHTCIRNFSWEILPGKINVLRARSGAGKSTLAKLLLQIYPLNSGRILIDDQDSKQIDLSEIRSSVTFINQDLVMFNRSILQILQYGTQASRQEVRDAWDGVKHYFDGKDLESSVGKDGENLSTGQKQIVRMLNCVLSDAKLMILDEPCSGLNHDLREIVQDLIQQSAYVHNKTVWLITHDDQIARMGDTTKTLK